MFGFFAALCALWTLSPEGSGSSSGLSSGSRLGVGSGDGAWVGFGLGVFFDGGGGGKDLEWAWEGFHCLAVGWHLLRSKTHTVASLQQIFCKQFGERIV